MTEPVPSELRLAIVMNGGVSLAVWMGGVAHEIDLLRRASESAAPTGGTSCESRLFDAWRELARRRHGRVVVDVVAGTSAGGLNGALLATSVARGAPLGDLRDVWLTAGALKRAALLPRRGDAGKLPSVLDGKFFADRIAREIRLPKVAEGQDDRDVTLFVTATAVAAPELTFTDGFGQSFTAPDHRRLYGFRNRPRRAAYVKGAAADAGWAFENRPLREFRPRSAPAEALADAARASASYPVAFAPIRETAELAAQREIPPGSSSESPATWLMDGGVLDNAPFGPVLDEVARRPVDGPWDRVVCYVVPSSGEMQTRVDLPPTVAPPWTRVVGAALNLPREADFRTDLEQLSELLALSGRRGEDTILLLREILDPPAEGQQLLGPADAAAALFDRYRKARAVAGIGELRLIAAGVELGGRLRPFSQPPADEVLAAGPLWVPSDLDDPGKPWSWGLSSAERIARLLLRSLRDPLRAGEAEAAGAASALSQHVDRLTALADAFTEAVRSSLRGLTGSTGDIGRLGHQALTAEANTVFTRLGLPDALATEMDGVFTRYAAYRGVAPDALRRACFSVEILSGLGSISRPFERTPHFDFLRLGPDVAGPLSPDLKRLGGAKLHGTQAMHFGAFGRAEWRAWDWMWGRLDAVAHLCRLLMPDATPSDLDEQIGRLQHLVLECETAKIKVPGRDFDDPAVRLDWLRDELARIEREPADLFRDKELERGTLAETVLRFAAGTDTDGVPKVVRRVGFWLNAVLAQEPAVELNRRQRAVRFATGLLRNQLWRRVGQPVPDPPR
jgi:predicted acylesterase/phospholipase RssA